jgi:dienelactone hydrolase
MPALTDDDLADFRMREVTLEGLTKRVYVAGSGPAVIVMAEMPGISPQVARFARWVRGAEYTVYMPSLFGRDSVVTVHLIDQAGQPTIKARDEILAFLATRLCG